MKHFRFIITLLIASLVMMGNCSRVRTSKEAFRAARIILVKYRSWNEMIEVDLAALKLNHFQTEYKYPSMASSTPSSSKTTKAPEKLLKPQDAQAITSFIRESEFMNLKDIYGAPAGQRYYPYQITVHLQGGKTKTVLFRSNPQFAGRPEAFKKVEKFLKSLLLSDKKKQE